MSPRLGVGRPSRPPQGRRPQRRPGGPPRRPGGDTLAQMPPRGKVDLGEIEIPGRLTVKELGELLRVSAEQVIKALITNGMMATINQTIDYDTAAIVAHDLGFQPREQAAPLPESTAVGQATDLADPPESMIARAPIVTIMGHVDHGKTSLLDAIREENVAGGEAGGITQHIGAYQIEKRQQRITFLDTPGHEAFTAMRARGAQATDVAILVVAADDGVQPQTREAIDHARAANVPIIVAINKVDRTEANPDRVKQQLAEVGVVVEDWGGDVPSVPVSAKTRAGIDSLLDMILLVAELQELRANPDRPAQGVVIEAKLDKARGPLATLLVQRGTLQLGDNVVVGPVAGRVRALFNDRGKRVRKAEPSMPVEILGLADVPQAGDRFVVAPDERTARAWAAEQIRIKQRESVEAPVAAVSLDDVFAKIQAGQIQELNVILKTDVQGSIDPIRTSLERLVVGDVKVKVIHTGTGNVTESDVQLAQASKGVIIAFNVRPEPGSRRLADSTGVDIREYGVIYQIVEHIERALTGMLAPTFAEVIEGHAEVLQLFKIGRNTVIAGSTVRDGKISRNSGVRVIRDGKKIFEGKLASLKRVKDDAREVAAGFECGIVVEGFNEFQPGDIVEAFNQQQV
jgi:translation initiation factor IF-2